MTPGTHLPGTIYQVGFFSNMYEYTAVIMLACTAANTLAADGAVLDAPKKN